MDSLTVRFDLLLKKKNQTLNCRVIKIFFDLYLYLPLRNLLWTAESHGLQKLPHTTPSSWYCSWECVRLWCGWVLTMLKHFSQRKLWNSQQLILRLHSVCLDITLCLLPRSNNFLILSDKLVTAPSTGLLASVVAVKGPSYYKNIMSYCSRKTNKDSCRSMVAWNKYWLSFYFVTKVVLREAASIWTFTGAQRCLIIFGCFQKLQSWCTPNSRCFFLKYCPGLILKRNKSLSSLSYNPRLLKR